MRVHLLLKLASRPRRIIMLARSPSATRRGILFGAAAGAVAAAQFGTIGRASAQAGRPRQLPAIRPGTHTSFGPLKQIDAGVLNVAYAEAGPANGHSSARLAV
jgi:hypothetical protein